MAKSTDLKPWQALLCVVIACASPAAGIANGTCQSCPTLIEVPAGIFVMGSAGNEAGREDDESPQHEVRIPNRFRISAHEVTVGQYSEFIAQSGYRPEPGCFFIDPTTPRWIEDSERGWRNPGFEQGDDHPVTCVNWADAQAYALWLGRRIGKTVRLPSEAEWEYIARAGSTSSRFWGESAADGCAYANAVDERSKDLFPGWKSAPCDDGYVYTNPVGHYKANAWGIYDMPGNLWEWTLDCWNDSHDGAPTDGSARLEGDCDRRIIRGAAWDDEAEDLRSANRLSVPAARRYNTIGIRVVAD